MTEKNDKEDQKNFNAMKKRKMKIIQLRTQSLQSAMLDAATSPAAPAATEEEGLEDSSSSSSLPITVETNEGKAAGIGEVAMPRQSEYGGTGGITGPMTTTTTTTTTLAAAVALVTNPEYEAKTRIVSERQQQQEEDYEIASPTTTATTTTATTTTATTMDGATAATSASNDDDKFDATSVPNAAFKAANNDVMEVDATSNDAKEEGEEDNADDDGEPPDKLWDLVKIFTTKKMLKSNAVKCMGDKCHLVACSIWSTTLNPKKQLDICLGKLLCTNMFIILH